MASAPSREGRARVGRRWLRRLALAIAAGALLVLGLVAATHLPGVRTRLAAAGVRLLAERYGIQARVGRFDYNLFALRFSITGLSLAARDRPGEPFLDAERVAVDLGWPSPFSTARIDDLTITNPRVHLATDANGALNLPSARRGVGRSDDPLRLDVRRVAVAGLSVIVAARPQAVGVEVRDVSVSLVGADGAIEGAVRTARPGTVRAGGVTVSLTGLDAQLSFDGTRLRVDSIRISTPGGTLEARAHVGPFERDVPLEGTVTGQLDASAVARLFGQAARGRITVAGTIAGTVTSPNATLRIASKALSYNALAPAAVTTAATVTRQVLTLDAYEVAAPWGRLQARGRFGFGASGQSELHATWAGADAGALLQATARLPVRVRSAVAGEAHATWHGPGMADLGARVVTRASPRPGSGLPLEGSARLEITEGQWSLVHEHRVGTTRVSGANGGRLDATALSRSTLGGTVGIDLASAREAVDELRRSGIRVPSPILDALDGRATVSATVGGQFGAPRVVGTVEGRDWRYGPLIGISADADFAADPGGVTIPRGTVRVPGAILEADALSLSRTGALGGALAFTGADVKPLLVAAPGWAQVSTGALALNGSIAGSVRAPAFDGALVAEQVSGFGQTLDRVELDVSGTGSRLVLRRLEARQAGGSLSAEGTYDGATRTYRLQAHSRALSLRPCGPAVGCPSLIPLTATVDATIDAAGSIDRPSGNISVAVRDASWDRYVPGPIDGRASAVDGAAVIAGRLPALAVQVDAVAALPSRTLRAVVRGDHMSLPSALAAAGLTSWAARVRGTISPLATVTIPATGLGDASVALELPPAEIGIDQLAFRVPEVVQLHLSPRAIHVRNLALSFGSSQLAVSGSLTDPAGDALHARIAADAADVRSLARAAGIEAAFDATGRLAVSIAATGTPVAPLMSADLEVRGGAGSWHGRRVSGVEGRLALRDGWLELTEAAAAGEGLALSARGRAPAAWLGEMVPAVLRSWLATPDGPPAAATIAGELTGSPSPLLRTLVPPEAVGEGELDLRWALGAAEPRLSAVHGDVTVERAALTVGGSRVAQAAPARVSIDGGRASLDEWRLTGDGTDLRITGAVDVRGRQPSFRVEATGGVNLAPARVLTGTRVRGTLDVQAGAAGTFDQPRLHGTLDLRDGVFSAPRLRIGAIDVAGHARLDGDHALIDRFSAVVNGAPLSASGQVTVFGSESRAHVLQVETSRLPLQLLGGARAEVDASLELSIAPGARRLSGRVDVTPEPFRGSVAVLKQLLALQRAGRAAAEEPITRAGPPLQLDVAIVTRDNLVVDSSFGRVELAADLRLVGTADRPLLKGQATIVEDGIIRAGGKTYRVIRGSLDFSNPRRIEPVLNIAGETRIGEHRIFMVVTGTADALQTSLSSDPPLSEPDLRSLLVTGRLADDRADRGRSIGQQEVAQTLSGDVFGFAADAIGLESVSIGVPDLDLLSGDIDAQTALNIRKAVSRQVEVLLSQGLEDNNFSWMLIYKPARSLQVRLLSRESEESAIEFRQELEFVRPPGRPGARATGPASGPRTDRPRVSVVRFSGATIATDAELLAQLELRPGERFDPWTWRAETRELRAFYRERGQYSVQVRPRRTTAPDGKSVVLEYEVVEGPRTTLRVDGYSFSEPALAQLQRAWSQTLSPAFLAADLERVARVALAEDGYIQARVTGSLSADSQAVEVVMAIIPGPRASEKTIGFEGNAAVPTARLLEAVRDAALESSAWDNADALEALVRELYRSLGYLDVRVQAAAPAMQAGRARLPVRIDEGPRYHLARINITGTQARSAADVRRAAPVADGAPYVVTTPEAVRRGIQGSYLAQAFDDVDVQVKPTVDRADASVALAVTVFEGQRRVVDGVRIEGTLHTRSKVVSDAVKLLRGAPLGPNEISAAQKRVYDTGAFRTVEIIREPSGGQAPTAVDLPVAATVRVEEAPRFVLRYGVHLSKTLDATSTESVYSVGAGADFRDRSFLGRAISAGLGARFDAVSQSARGLLGTSSTFGTRVRSNLFVSATRERTNPVAGSDVVDRQASFTAEQRLRVSRQIDVSWGLAYDYRKLLITPVEMREPPLAIEGWTVGPRTAFVWDTRDAPFDATRGYFFSSGLDVGLQALGSEIDYTRVLLQQFAFFPAGRVVFASAVRWGTLHTFGRENLLSLDVRFKAGGSNTVRGYPEDSLSTATFLDVPLGGKEMLVLNQEVRFPIYKWFRGVGFIDAGGTYNDFASFGPLHVGTGFGLRLASPFALIRVDLGFPVDPRPEDKARVYFSIGQAF